MPGKQKLVVACLAPVGKPHPSTRKTGYCEAHHAEFEDSMATYRNRVSRWKRGTGADPGTKADWIANIQFTPLDRVGWLLSVNDQAAIHQAVAELAAASGRLSEFSADKDAYFAWSEQQVRQMVAEALASHLRAITLLRSLTDNE